jgi:hypothetical protein
MVIGEGFAFGDMPISLAGLLPRLRFHPVERQRNRRAPVTRGPHHESVVALDSLEGGGDAIEAATITTSARLVF